MKSSAIRWCVAVGLTVGPAFAANSADPKLADAPMKDGFPKFQVQEIATDLAIGYAVILADINGDKKPDIVVVDKHRVVWYENPTWKMRTILQGKTAPDNVCVTALDIDGNGDLELVLGAAWKPSDTKTPGTLQWLKRGKTLDDEWTMYPIPCDEPTVHRVRAIDLDGDGKPEVVHVPLQGRDATAKGNYTDGRPVRIMAYTVPADPTKPGNWKPRVLSEDLHVTHNFWPYTPPGATKPMSILVGGYEGYAAVLLGENGATTTAVVHPGNQDNPKGSRGVSEIKSGHFRKPDPASKDRAAGAFVATVEPWHGNEVAVYVSPGLDRKPTRRVLDNQLRWGHAVWCADLDGDGTDELIIGVRDDPNPKAGDKFTERRGVRVYKNTDGKGETWDRLILDNGGVAVEDLAAADLDGDGKPDIVAVGRATGNCRIYWNRGK